MTIVNIARRYFVLRDPVERRLALLHVHTSVGVRHVATRKTPLRCTLADSVRNRSRAEKLQGLRIGLRCVVGALRDPAALMPHRILGVDGRAVYDERVHRVTLPRTTCHV